MVGITSQPSINYNCRKNVYADFGNAQLLTSTNDRSFHISKALVRTRCDSTVPVQTGSGRTELVLTRSDQTALVQTGSDRTVLVQTGSDRTIPVLTGSGRTVLVLTDSNRTVPVQTGSGQTVLVLTCFLTR